MNPHPLGSTAYQEAADGVLDPATHPYVFGGAGDGSAVRRNAAAWERFHLRPRVLVDATAADTGIELFGARLSMPLAVAPMASQAAARAEGELATARAAQDAGTVMCVSVATTHPLEQIRAAAPDAQLWMQLYMFQDHGVVDAVIDYARDVGCGAFVVTVDSPIVAQRELSVAAGAAHGLDVPTPVLGRAMGRPDARAAEMAPLLEPGITWSHLERLIASCDAPVLAKGILTGEDAALACDVGAAGIVVSNHGGRQLEGAPAGIEVLEEVLEAVAGRAEVLVDGGVRRASHVVTALALGARAVLIGRPVLWALAVDGEDGVRALLDGIREDLRRTLMILGAPRVADVGRRHVAVRS